MSQANFEDTLAGVPRVNKRLLANWKTWLTWYLFQDGLTSTPIRHESLHKTREPWGLLGKKFFKYNLSRFLVAILLQAAVLIYSASRNKNWGDTVNASMDHDFFTDSTVLQHKFCVSIFDSIFP